MMIDPAQLPDVLPTERLLANGVAIPAVRAELRRIADGRNAISVATVWAYLLGTAVAIRFIDAWWAWPVAFVLMAPVHVRFAILMHEAAHKLLFTSKRTNDVVGTWLIAFPALVPMAVYRRSHFAHHRHEFGPEEPDIAFYGGYPTEWAVLRRRLIRDAVGISGWKNLTPLFRALRTASARPTAARILAIQALMFGLIWVLSGEWFGYFILWLLPWMTGWRVVNRLRALAEHGGLGESDDRRRTTHNIRQSWPARFWIVPYHTGWHLAHHVDMGVPWRNLPAFHRELEAAGYVTEACTYRSYVTLWRAICGGPRP